MVLLSFIRLIYIDLLVQLLFKKLFVSFTLKFSFLEVARFTAAY